ncbi:MAG: hypothetical protein R3C56_27995 [Pirellulaceae bacterium]
MQQVDIDVAIESPALTDTIATVTNLPSLEALPPAQPSSRRIGPSC